LSFKASTTKWYPSVTSVAVTAVAVVSVLMSRGPPCAVNAVHLHF
jgi:hypothetical protein